MIVADDEIMAGVPCVAGTRIPATTILGMLAAVPDVAPILFDFPQLTREDICEVLQFAADELHRRYEPDGPRWSRMTVGELAEQLDASDYPAGNVIGLMNPDRTARAFVLEATPEIVRLMEDLTMRADVPPAPESTG